MISVFLILFFVSLLAILVMVGNKLALLRNGEMVAVAESEKETFNLEHVKHSTIRNLKKYGRMSLVSILRFYVRSSNFLKNKYREIMDKIENKESSTNTSSNMAENKEASKFLKMISEYKHKIRNIKDEVKEEENS